MLVVRDRERREPQTTTIRQTRACRFSRRQIPVFGTCSSPSITPFQGLRQSPSPTAFASPTALGLHCKLQCAALRCTCRLSVYPHLTSPKRHDARHCPISRLTRIAADQRPPTPQPLGFSLAAPDQNLTAQASNATGAYEPRRDETRRDETQLCHRKRNAPC